MYEGLILVVEDVADAARLVEYHLRRRGYRTIWAPDGREALNRVLAHRPDVIVLDVMLPHLSGFEVCRMLRAAPATARIPVLMLTARGDIEDKLKGFRLGADDYLTKPYEMAELLARVEVLFRRSTARHPLSQFADL
jgi:two-component system phosphate regulon response regulator PhoB